MKHKFTYLIALTFSLFFSTHSFAQTDGDFRTIASGNWSDNLIWERYDGTSSTWLPAGAGVFPNSTNGVITIRATHTVLNDIDVTADQLVIEATAILNLNNFPTVNTLTIANGAGTDLQVDGILRLGGFEKLASLAGANAVVNGELIWTSGELQVPTVISATGTANLSGDFTKDLTTTLVNNGTFNWATGTSAGGIFFNNGSFTNNGTINEQFQSDRGIADNGGTNTFINTGIFNKTTNFAFGNFNVPVTNSGTIQGKGTVSITGTISNTGIIKPANPTVGILNLTPNVLTGQTSAITLKITGAGTTAGTDYDQLAFAGGGVLDLSGTTLNLSDEGSGAVGTIYTILTYPAGTITGTFAAVNLAGGSLGNITYNATSVTAEKLFALPLTWGSFTALVKNNTVVLNWSTLTESNTSHFDIEYSSDGQKFTTLGSVNAKGNSSVTLNYTYTHSSPSLNKSNFYRLKQVDLNSKSTNSVVRIVRFNNGQVLASVLVTPNPVRDVLQLTSQTSGIDANIIDMNGRIVKVIRLKEGLQQVNVQDLHAGVYQINFYQNNQRLSTQKIVKL